MSGSSISLWQKLNSNLEKSGHTGFPLFKSTKEWSRAEDVPTISLHVR